MGQNFGIKIWTIRSIIKLFIFQELENKPGPSSDENQAIEVAVKKYVDNSVDSTWKASLAREVFEHDHGIIVHGYRLNGTEEEAKVTSAMLFLTQELKAPTDLLNKVNLKEVIRLGNDNGVGNVESQI